MPAPTRTKTRADHAAREFARDRARIDAALRRREDRRAERIVPFRWGSALLVERLPQVWDLNFIRVDAAPRRRAAVRLAAEAERLFAPTALSHRRVTVDDERLGETLAPGFAGLGWTVERLTLMVLRLRPGPAAAGTRRPGPRPPAAAAEETTLDALRPLLGRLLAAMPHVRDEDTVRQLLGESELTGRVAGTRRFGAPAGGPYAAACRLHLDGDGLAEIDDVGAAEDRRREGLGGAVVAAALDAARADGRDLTYLLADEDDWPRAWYRRLGFVPAGRRWAFARRLDSPA